MEECKRKENADLPCTCMRLKPLEMVQMLHSINNQQGFADHQDSTNRSASRMRRSQEKVGSYAVGTYAVGTEHARSTEYIGMRCGRRIVGGREVEIQGFHSTQRSAVEQHQTQLRMVLRILSPSRPKVMVLCSLTWENKETSRRASSPFTSPLLLLLLFSPACGGRVCFRARLAAMCISVADICSQKMCCAI